MPGPWASAWDGGRSRQQEKKKGETLPGDSKWPFDHLVRCHLTISKGHLTIPKRSQRIARTLNGFWSGLEWNFEFVFPRSPKFTNVLKVFFFRRGLFHEQFQGKVLLMVGSTLRVLCIVLFVSANPFKSLASFWGPEKTPLQNTQVVHSPETIGRSNRWLLGKEKNQGLKPP